MFHSQHFNPVFAGCLCSFWDQQFTSDPRGSAGAAGGGDGASHIPVLEHPQAPRPRGYDSSGGLGGSAGSVPGAGRKAEPAESPV